MTEPTGHSGPSQGRGSTPSGSQARQLARAWHLSNRAVRRILTLDDAADPDDAGDPVGRIHRVKQMYHPSDLAAMDPLVLMKNLDHVRMTSRRLSYILQQQVHLYTPEANQVREQIDVYVEAERQIEGEMARRRIRA